MDDKYKNKYRVSSARMPCWDYGSNGAYYITICTKDREHFFGEIVHNVETQNIASQNIASQNVVSQNVASLRKSAIGEIAYNNWLNIPDHFPFVELDEFVIMPNHMHGVLFINKINKDNWQLNKFGVQSQNLASVIRGYKASVKTYATINAIKFDWQPRYYDHVIRNEKEYLNISGYIVNNPDQWLLNGDNADNLYKP
jgi:putative transposase